MDCGARASESTRDQYHGGRRADECSRKALWTEARQSLPAKDLTDILNQIVAWRGTPAYIRCDNGPEFISGKLAEWAENNHVELRFIQRHRPSDG